MSQPPENIQADSSKALFHIIWNSQEQDQIPYRLLRGLCPCAVCVNELTGERTYGVDDVAEDINPVGMELVGNYALKIQWSDQHATGLYTWEYLRKISDATEFTGNDQ